MYTGETCSFSISGLALEVLGWRYTGYAFFINKLAPVCLHDLVHMKTLNILSDTTTFWKYHRSNPHGKNLSDLLHLHCGTASQIISGLNIASLNSRVFCSPGMGQNVDVLHVDD